MDSKPWLHPLKFENFGKTVIRREKNEILIAT